MKICQVVWQSAFITTKLKNPPRFLTHIYTCMEIPYQTANLPIFCWVHLGPNRHLIPANNVLIQIVAAATINFSFAGVQLLIEINTQLLQEFLIIPFMMHHYCPPPLENVSK